MMFNPKGKPMKHLIFTLFFLLPISLFGLNNSMNLIITELKQDGVVEVVELAEMYFSGKERSLVKRCFLLSHKMGGYLYSSKIDGFNVTLDDKEIDSDNLLELDKGISSCFNMGVRKHSGVTYFNGTSREYKYLDGVYRVESDENPLKGKKSFTLSYRVIDTLYRDSNKTDAIYFNYLLDGWNASTEKSLIYLKLPPNFNTQNSKIELIPNSNKLRYIRKDDRTIEIKFFNIASQEFTIKLVFDKGLINATPLNMDKKHTPWRKKYHNIWWAVGLFYLIAMFVIWAIFRKKEPRKSIHSIANPPKDIGILQIGYLLDDMEKAYTAQTISLIERGYLEPTKNSETGIRYKRTKKNIRALDEHEESFLREEIYKEIEFSQNRVDFTFAFPSPSFSSTKNGLWKRLSKWLYTHKYSKIDREKLRLNVAIFFIGSLQFFYFLLNYLIVTKEFGANIMLVLFFQLFIFVLLSMFIIRPLLSLALKIKNRYFTLLINRVFLSFGLLIVLEYIASDLFHTGNIFGWNSPFLIIATLSLISLGLLKSIGGLTDKGQALKEELLNYKAYLEKNSDAKNLEYSVLFGFSDLYLGDFAKDDRR